MAGLRNGWPIQRPLLGLSGSSLLSLCDKTAGPVDWRGGRERERERGRERGKGRERQGEGERGREGKGEGVTTLGLAPHTHTRNTHAQWASHLCISDVAGPAVRANVN